MFESPELYSTSSSRQRTGVRLQTHPLLVTASTTAFRLPEKTEKFNWSTPRGQEIAWGLAAGAGRLDRATTPFYHFRPMRVLIKSGTIVDPSQRLEMQGDLLVEDGVVREIAREISVADAEILDARGCIVAPGFIDLHVHLREPGREDVETIETGTQAAAAGGFTAVCAMPNTQPVNDNRAVTRFILERAHDVGLVRVYPIGALTQGLKGEALAEIGEMREAGIIAISDDGRPVMNAQILRRAMEYARQLEIPVIDHCEDLHLSAGGVMNEGLWSLRLGLKGIPGAAEEVHVARDLILAELTGAHVHLAHLSTARSIELVRQAKRRGVRVSCEVTPHHFTLTEEAVRNYDTNAKMNPPLRTEQDVRAIHEALADGTIDAIATDHAPHHPDEKALEFDRAPFGVVGLETAVSLAIDRLVHTGVIGWMRLVELFSTNPARIAHLPGGTLKPGAQADITILDPSRPVIVRAERFRSKGRNTPFDGWSLTGSVRATLVSGRLVYCADPL
jgi:dihydroorotase